MFVASAYRLCMHGLLDTNNLKVNCSWDLIWILKIPPKEEKKLYGEFVGIPSQPMILRDKGVNCPTNCIFVIQIMRIVFICFSSVQATIMFGACVWHIQQLTTL